jgi:hypothetical protein
MRLAGQLLAVSAVTLLLPWAGCQYAREVETALRDGEGPGAAGHGAPARRGARSGGATLRPPESAGPPGRGRGLDIYLHPLPARRRWTASSKTGARRPSSSSRLGGLELLPDGAAPSCTCSP